MNKLDVYFNNQKVGILTEKNSRLSFKYLPIANTPIAHLLPLQEKAFNDKETRAFFSNLLPEGDIAKKIAQIKQISEGNPFALLKAVGGECAGAVSLYPQDQEPILNREIKEISEHEISQIIKNLSDCPLLTKDGVRLSLAGAQEKLALTMSMPDKTFYIPSDNYISNVIIKPQKNFFDDLIYNEFFCMNLAHSLNITTPNTSIMTFEDEQAYIVNRYDRVFDENLNIIRIHQEDFCQALGLSNKKYQSEEGPSIKQCYNFIKNNNFNKKAEQLNKFVTAVVYNFFIGNSDAHGKNFSFLHTAKGYELTPFYDLVSTQVYADLTTNMAMSIAREYDPQKIRRHHFESLAKDLDINPKLFINSIDNFCQIILKQANEVKKLLILQGFDSPIYDEIIKIIEKRSSQIKS